MTSINVVDCSTCGYRIGMVRVPLVVFRGVDVKNLLFPINHTVNQIMIDRDGVVLQIHIIFS